MKADSWWKSRRRCSAIATACAGASATASSRPCTIEVISRTVRQMENVEKVRGGRIAAVENTAAGWPATSRSTGLPQTQEAGQARAAGAGPG
ncbi:hypothetical protein [Nocardioides convexus]|uniref:hypothetical protein n=1 Tax=Nocardioides convexus TaxID=2712224 RepID=UPI002418AC7D|nr:hypothetical protein [Nocardioides convexus]